MYRSFPLLLALLVPFVSLTPKTQAAVVIQPEFINPLPPQPERREPMHRQPIPKKSTPDVPFKDWSEDRMLMSSQSFIMLLPALLALATVLLPSLNSPVEAMVIIPWSTNPFPPQPARQDPTPQPTVLDPVANPVPSQTMPSELRHPVGSQFPSVN
ncbi:MAG: hypothetical protein DHS80DRAFT_31470 [Piptocephalis tieghemiana]|nr:MAG: hypothetical protein DHS80DRAFT_31470 [Piptocephalis tieghemiana]